MPFTLPAPSCRIWEIWENGEHGVAGAGWDRGPLPNRASVSPLAQQGHWWGGVPTAPGDPKMTNPPPQCYSTPVNSQQIHPAAGCGLGQKKPVLASFQARRLRGSSAGPGAHPADPGARGGPRGAGAPPGAVGAGADGADKAGGDGSALVASGEATARGRSTGNPRPR